MPRQPEMASAQPTMIDRVMEKMAATPKQIPTPPAAIANNGGKIDWYQEITGGQTARPSQEQTDAGQQEAGFFSGIKRFLTGEDRQTEKT